MEIPRLILPFLGRRDYLHGTTLFDALLPLLPADADMTFVEAFRKADEVLFSGYSPGGTSLASDPDYMSAALASQVMQLGGLGSFNRIDLGKKLAGKAASVSPAIGVPTIGVPAIGVAALQKELTDCKIEWDGATRQSDANY